MATTPEDKDQKKPDASQQAFMREVDDAVRDDMAGQFLTRFGKPLAAVIIAGLVGYAGWLWYSNSKTESAGALGGELMASLDAMGSKAYPAAGAAAAKLAKTDNPTYRAAALLAQGNAAEAIADNTGAVAKYAAVAKDANAPEDLRQLALIRQTLAEMDIIQPDAVIARMQPLTASEAPWAATALEITALAKLKQGKSAEAQALYSKISARKDTPPSLKTRASQMASMLSGSEAPSASTPKAANGAATATKESNK